MSKCVQAALPWSVQTVVAVEIAVTAPSRFRSAHMSLASALSVGRHPSATQTL